MFCVNHKNINHGIDIYNSFCKNLWTTLCRAWIQHRNLWTRHRRDAILCCFTRTVVSDVHIVNRFGKLLLIHFCNILFENWIVIDIAFSVNTILTLYSGCKFSNVSTVKSWTIPVPPKTYLFVFVYIWCIGSCVILYIIQQVMVQLLQFFIYSASYWNICHVLKLCRFLNYRPMFMFCYRSSTIFISCMQ